MQARQANPAPRARTTTTVRRVAAAGLATFGVVAGVTACGVTPADGTLPDCPTSMPATASRPASTPSAIEVLWADSASQRSSAITADRLAAVRQQALIAAACGARLTVKLVAGQADPVTLYSGEPRQHGGTDTATARLSIRYTDATVMPAVSAAAGPALAAAANDHESPADLFQVAADDAATSGSPLAVVLLSDMVAHGPQLDLNRAVSSADAVAAAHRTPVPDLDGSHVSVYGVGSTSDARTAPTDWLAAVRSYASTLCATSRAAGCVVTTQYPAQS